MNLKSVHNVYFIGIGGIGMSALARYFHAIGKQVAGYDKTATKITAALQHSAIHVHYDKAVDLIPKQFLIAKHTLVVYTPAIPKGHQELQYFINNDFTVMKRAAVLGLITIDTFCLAVAGTHGKTTTSAILGHIFKASNVDATSFLGGISENYHSNLILGGDKTTIVEADEYDRSFLQLAPDIACVTSMDADHLDIYKEKSALEDSFRAFASKVTKTLIIKYGLPLKGITFGFEEQAEYQIKNIQIQDGIYIFDVQTPNNFIKSIKFHLPGKHNLLNAVGALAMANEYGIPLPSIAKALLSFKGVDRRFSYRIKQHNLVLIDDYAHHPTEIEAVLASVKEMYPNKKILTVFQPHLYSRTQDFADEFAISLAKTDALILLEIYPAREMPIEGVTSQWLLNKIALKAKQLVSKKDLLMHIKKYDADIIVMLGAGDIGVLVNDVKKGLLNTEKQNSEN